MADRTALSTQSGFSRSRLLLAAASGALLLTACSPTTQQGDAARPVTSVPATGEDELASLLRVAGMTRQSGDFDTAAALYRRAHEIDPRDPRPVVEMARMLDDAGAYGEAALMWQDAIAIAPNDPAVQGGYGVTLARLGQPELAVTYLQKSTAVDPTPTSLNALGVMLDQTGDAAGAQQAYRAGLKLAPTDLRLANNLGLSLALSGHQDEAVETLERIVVRPDATARHRQNLSLAYALAGDNAQSEKFGRIDFDPAEAQRNVMRYASIVTLPDHQTRVAAVSALRGAQAGTLKPAASIQSAALVKERQAAPETTAADIAEARVTPILNTTRLTPPKPAKPAMGASSVAPAPMPAPPASAKPVTKPAIVAQASQSAVEPMASPAAPAAPISLAPVAQAEPAEVRAKRPAPAAALAAADAFPPAAKPQTYRSEFVPMGDAADAPADARIAAVAPSQPEFGDSEPVAEAPAEPVSVAQDMPQMAAASPAEPADDAMPPAAQPAGPAAEGEIEPEPAYGPAIAGIEVPSVDDQLIVAASAYHAGEYEFAARMWQPLADAGVLRAQFHLGALYYEGHGVERDLKQAYLLLRQAEMAGFADARIILALVEAKLPSAERDQADAQLAAVTPR